MTLYMQLARWRVRQRRQVREALWMHGPFTRTEARTIARQIRYSPVRAARLINAYAADKREMRAREIGQKQAA